MKSEISKDEKYYVLVKTHQNSQQIISSLQLKVSFVFSTDYCAYAYLLAQSHFKA